MTGQYLLEISVESVEAAMAAERAGAQRIEFCSNAKVGGTTPSPELQRAVRERVRLPIFVMNRPRAGDFVYSTAEFDAMNRDIEIAKQNTMDGIVLGLLKSAGEIDIVRTKQLVERARPLPVTFHRAFDECTDLRGSLEDVIRTGAARLLTSGGKRTAPEALEMIDDLVQTAGNRLIVMPGSGIHAGNIREVVRRTGAREYHAGLSTVAPNPAENISRFEEEVRKLATALEYLED
jgi:copper homeostasis protein